MDGEILYGAVILDSTKNANILGTDSNGTITSSQTMAYSLFPIGFPMPWFNTIASIPSGWLFLNGQAVSRTTYASLFAYWGTYWGSGNGTTTFNLPDTTNRVMVGANADNSGKAKTTITGSALQTGGNISHSHGVNVSGVLPSDGFAVTSGYDEIVPVGGDTLNSSGSTDTQQHINPFLAVAWIVKAL